MNEKTVDYEAVLADMKLRRAKIDAGIAAIEEMLGLQISAPPVDGSSPRPLTVSGPIQSDTFFGCSIPDAILKCLAIAKQKQTAKRITESLERGGLTTTAKNLYSNVYTALSRLEEAGQIVKVGKEWGLPEWYPGLRKAKPLGNGKDVDKGAESPITPTVEH